MQRWLLALGVSLLVWNLHVSAYQPFDWAYGGRIGPSSWHKTYSDCGGTLQSPINVNTRMVKYDPNLKPFVLSRKSALGKYTVKNLGLNTEIFFEDTIWEATVEGSSKHCYRLDQIHFHWGSKDYQGSEHSIDGKKFPIEAHIVMWNCAKYSNATAAKTGKNGLAVISILFEIDNKAPLNPVMKCIASALDTKKIRQCPCNTPHDIAEIKMDGFDINQLLPRSRGDFYRYPGSLTTPPCTENVMWTIFRETVYINEHQIRVFRRLRNRERHNGGRECMCNNFRPVQRLNPTSILCFKREVTASFQKNSPNYKYRHCKKND